MSKQITATVLADSATEEGVRLTTLECTFPRWIHAELLTHAALARNAASSRAIPVSKLVKQIKSDPAIPIMYGKQQSGMQSYEELTGIRLFTAKHVWKMASWTAATYSSILAKIGLHKQYANRPAEYAQVYKVVLSATEWDNFFHLRRHKDAQPEIKALADVIYNAMMCSTPITLKEGEWHLPYLRTTRDNTIGVLRYYTTSGTLLSIEEAKQVSASCCAQISYRLLDDSLEKAKKIYKMLINAEVIHASPFEHQGTPVPKSASTTTEGITHTSKENTMWSGKFKGWIQARHLLKNNTCIKYTPH